TPLGAPVTQSLTIHNSGDGDLSVSGFNGSQLPAGFSLVTGFGNTTVFPGGALVLTVQIDAAPARTDGAVIHIRSSDPNTGSFDVTLSGVVTAPEIRVFAGGRELQSGDPLNFGITVLGTPVTQTITIQNSGNGNLLVTPLDSSSLPAGF